MSASGRQTSSVLSPGIAWACVAALAVVFGSVVGLVALQPPAHRPDVVTPLIPSATALLSALGLWMHSRKVQATAEQALSSADVAAEQATTAARQTNGELKDTVAGAVTDALAKTGVVDRRAPAPAPAVPLSSLEAPASVLPYVAVPAGSPIPPSPVGPPLAESAPAAPPAPPVMPSEAPR